MATASEASQQANRSGIDPKRLVVIFYLVAGIVLALFLEHVFGLLWARFGWRDPELIEGARLARLHAGGLSCSPWAWSLAAYFHPQDARASRSTSPSS